MDMRKYSGETFIKADDVRAEPLQRRIRLVKAGRFERSELVFEEDEILSLNQTNVRILRRAYGRSSDGWVGKDIELQFGNVEYQGKPMDSVIVKPLSPPLSLSQQAEIAAKDDEINDDIPF
jgi:hypothetical protein